MTKLIYLDDSYKTEYRSIVTKVVQNGDLCEVVAAETIFYPQGGGQPSDIGEIRGKSGTLTVTHCRMQEGNVIHQGTLHGSLAEGDEIQETIKWKFRLEHMRRHSAGHIVHDAVSQTIPLLTPIKGDHGKNAFVEYEGLINPILVSRIENLANLMVIEARPIHTEYVTLEELKNRAAWIPPHLPKHKPLRIVQIEGNNAIANGGTQVKNTAEVGEIKITQVENLSNTVKVHYQIESTLPTEETKPTKTVQAAVVKASDPVSPYLENFVAAVEKQKSAFKTEMEAVNFSNREKIWLKYFGSSGISTALIKQIRDLPLELRRQAGMIVNDYKESAETVRLSLIQHKEQTSDWFDVTLPGISPPQGHLHIVTQGILEITRIFEKIGFTRVRHPEVDSDWYAFGSLNMPPQHPARDDWETFFVQSEKLKVKSEKFGKIVLTPHTSNGQVREMEKGKFPIRMINIAKCYRRQSDVSHVPMFHQFEGLYVDKNVSIAHLKGVLDYFVKQFFGPLRKSRIRPYHFQFTEPSFEVDISCGVCSGTGCKLCKEGWLELGGAGMVHPVVLKNGAVPTDYNGFAFGWGVERTYMMKAGTRLDDIRLLYSNDVRFLEQF